jgi:hypothetical protein
MTPERWKQLDALFHEALELQGEARAAHLAKVCGGDEQLRAEAERLIAAHERESSFIDSPILAEAAALTDGANESPVGRSIGPYKVISLLGRGGMGEVYRALDSRLGREVAIKLLPAAFSTDKDRLRRFEQEARAAGMLNHPNVLTLYDIGAHEGAPYISARWVGSSLPSSCWRLSSCSFTSAARQQRRMPLTFFYLCRRRQLSRRSRCLRDQPFRLMGVAWR